MNFNDIPIGKKISLIVGLGMGAAMLAVLLVFLAFDRHTLKQHLLDELRGHARVMALRSSVALIFNDARNAQQNLASLAVRPSVLAACIFKNEPGGSPLFASYLREQTEAAKALCSLHDSTPKQAPEWLSVEEKIFHNEEEIGLIRIISDTSTIQARTLTWIYFGALMFLLAISFATLMTARMKKAVVAPLENLMFSMRDVMTKKDLTVRAEAAGRDEVGKLVEQFNAMLDLIDNSQRTLEAMYRDLVVNSANAEKSLAELEAKNQQIKGMLSGAAHDLRQPLQAMSLFVATIEHHNADTQLQPLLNQLKQAMHNLANLFGEILDVSRAEATGKIDAFKTVSLPALLAQLEIEFSAMAKDKGLNFRLRTQGNSLHSIPGLLERIIRNLISNAISYTERGSVLVSERRRGDELVIEVWDSGCGIAEEKQQSIFQRFEQVQASKPDGTPQRGYGLGLALVKQFAEMLGYRVEVASKPQRGSRFRIAVPERFIAPPAELEKQIQSEDFPPLAAGEQHILLIDDDAVIRQGLQQVFALWGLSCTALSSLTEVHGYFSTPDYRDPDLVISDWQLGTGVQGDQVIHTIFQHLGFPVPALIITGSADPADRAAIQASGFDVVFKPLATRELKEKLLALLG